MGYILIQGKRVFLFFVHDLSGVDKVRHPPAVPYQWIEARRRVARKEDTIGRHQDDGISWRAVAKHVQIFCGKTEFHLQSLVIAQ